LYKENDIQLVKVENEKQRAKEKKKGKVMRMKEGKRQ